MGKKIFNWSVKKIADMIDRMIANNFDCVIVICGQRGIGKSTLAWKICVATEFQRFNPEYDIIFKKEKVINAIAKRKKSIIFADEIINTAFNRDFYTTGSKDFIKILTMNRDKRNLFISCLPTFASLDTQFKGLIKIRIDVIARGLAIIHTPNKSLYSKDRWDTALNEKIERKWLHAGMQNPQYAKLTTFRGILKFQDLTENQKKLYLELKDKKRNEVIDGENANIDNEPLQDYDRIFYLVLNKKFRDKEHLKEYCEMHDLDYEKILTTLRYRIKKAKLNTTPMGMLAES